MRSSSDTASQDDSNPERSRSGTTLSDTDRRLLGTYEPLVDALADFGGSGCEIALHTFEDAERSIVKIANGHVTGRSAGSPMTDLGIRLADEDDGAKAHWTYFTRSANGRPLKSLSSMIRNPRGRAIGMLCINIDLSTPLSEVIAELVPGDDSSLNERPEPSVMSADELVERSVAEVVEAISTDPRISNAAKNKEIVAELHNRGIFDIKGAIDLVSRVLGVSRYTIYNYIREAK